MRRAEREGIDKLRFPARRALARARVDQIDRDGWEHLQRTLHRFGRRDGIMVASEKGERGIAQRLHADRQARHPGLLQAEKIRPQNIIGIGFQRDLGAALDAERLRRCQQDRAQFVRPQQRRRAAAEVNRVERAMLRHPRPVRMNVRRDGLDQRSAVAVLGGVDVEVAIRADARAVRPVHVQAKPEMRSERRGGIGHVSRAARSFFTASARWLIACLRSGSISPKVRVSPVATKTGS